MLSIFAITSAAAAKHYFEQDNFHSENSKEALEHSEWYGLGAKELNLSGSVDLARFEQLLNGEVDGVHRLGRQIDGEWRHQPGWDLTFSAPKSVSVLAELGNDNVRAALNDAYNGALKVVLDQIQQQEATTRMTRNGKVESVKTGNLIFALHHHNTSRELDMQRHTHAVVINATKTENGWRSIESQGFYDRKMHYGLMFRNEYAYRLQLSGFTIEQTREDGLFEIVGVPDFVNKHFSQRRDQIEQQLAEMGFDSSKAAEVAALDTRTNHSDDNLDIQNTKINAQTKPGLSDQERKDMLAILASPRAAEIAALRTRKSKVVVEQAVLRQAWNERAKAIGFDAQGLYSKLKKSRIFGVKQRRLASELVDYVAEKLAERDARFLKQDFYDDMLKSNIGALSHEAIQNAIDLAVKDKRLIDKGASYTTKHAIKLERNAIKLMYRGYETYKGIADQKVIDAYIAKLENHDGRAYFKLTAGQRKAVEMVIQSKDRFMAIQGYAGTGKTTALGIIKQISEAKGYSLKGFAPTGEASTVLQEKTGVISTTIDQHFIDMRKALLGNTQINNKREIWLVDESGLSSSRQMEELMTLADKTNARVVFIGDIRQMESIEAGRLFAQLQEAGIERVEMRDIIRQKNPELKGAIVNTIADEIDKAMKKLARNMREFDTDDKRISALVDDYFKLDQNDRNETMIIAPVNKQRHEINDLLRDRFKSEGKLHSNIYKTHALENRDLRKVEYLKSFSYQKGDIVRFRKDYKRFKIHRHEYLVVEDRNISKNTVRLKSLTDGRIVPQWNPERVAGREVEVYRLRHVELQVGDDIRWRRNDKELDLINGNKMTIKGIHKNNITAEYESGKNITFDADQLRYKHLDYSYTDTVYTAQGKDKPRVMALVESFRRNVINNKSFYVTISRAVKSVSIYTDSVQKTKKAIETRRGINSVAINAKEYSDELKSAKKIRLGRGFNFMGM